MILKFDQDVNEVFYLDASFHNGVTVQRWSLTKDYLTGSGDEIKPFYEQIVYRHLNAEREENGLLDRLEVFLKEAIGQKYGLSTSKLLFTRRTVKIPKGGKSEVKRDSEIGEPDEEERMYIDEDRTFFCSELIAKAYKVLGVIEDDD